jgi:hypothetical protein
MASCVVYIKIVFKSKTPSEHIKHITEHFNKLKK